MPRLLLPRVLLGLGALGIATPRLVALSDTTEALLEVGGGLALFVGALWMFLAQRRKGGA